MRMGENQFVISAQVALDGAADRLLFTPAFPVRINRFGYLVGVLLDNTATPLILSLDTIDLLAAPVRTERATITRPAVDEAIGTYVRSAPVSAFKMDPNLDNNVLLAGHQAVVEVKQAAVAGDGFVWIEYTPLSSTDYIVMPTTNVHYPIEVAV